MKETRQLRPGENFFAYLMLAFSLFVFYEAYKISGITSIASPGTIPMGAALVMVVSMIAHLIDNRRQKKPDLPGLRAELAQASKETFPGVFLLYIVIVIAYVALIQPVHFMPSSFIFFLVSLLCLKGAGIKKSLIISVGMLAAIYIIFHYIFRVMLP